MDLSQALGGHAKLNEPLARHTTFRIGGPAELFVQAQTIGELIRFVELARRYHVPFFILGNGSNVLVLDGGIRGLVIENHCDHYQLDILNDHRAVLKAESGATLPGLANRLARQGWAGLEWAVGVPGTIGGAVIGNAGAHGGCIADTLLRVTVLDKAGDRRELPKSELGLVYRSSRFKQERNVVVLGAEFEMTRGDPAELVARMTAFAEQRRRTQPTDPSVGSMFKNPPGDYAGRLIEQAGLKGKRVGNVQISPVHANFFVNHGGASASDVLQLVEIVRERVRVRSGVALELEIEIVGEESGK
jgi:UDP-N-acetylmuramate dehydrogenase